MATFASWCNIAPIEELLELEKKARHNYHNSSEIMSDCEYDYMVDILKRRSPTFIPPVGAKIREDDTPVKLPIWLGSANKVTPTTISEWLNKTTLQYGPNYIVSKKLDGVSALLHMTKDGLKLYTRGNGKEGGDKTYIIPYIHNLPQSKNIPVNTLIRGELIISLEVFQKKFANSSDTISNGSSNGSSDGNLEKKTYKNPRGLVVGLLGGKTARDGLEDLNFVAYEIINISTVEQTPLAQQYKLLQEWGFSVVDYQERQIPLGSEMVEKLSNQLTYWKNDGQYAIDGIIIHTAEKYIRNVSGNPSYMVAYKILDQNAVIKSKVTMVEWNISKWGQLKPVVIIEPVDTGDITITRLSGHHAKYIIENRIGPGATISVTRSKDVIPYILAVIEPSQTPATPPAPWHWDETETNAIADITAARLPEKDIASIKSFFSCIGAKHVSDATITKLYNGGLTTIKSIICASVDRMCMAGLGPGVTQRAYDSIRTALANATLATILGGAGILGYGVGVKRVETILQQDPGIIILPLSKTEALARLSNIASIGPKMSERIADNLEEGRKFLFSLRGYLPDSLLADLDNATPLVEPEAKKVSSKWSGQVVVFTGFRDRELEKWLLQNGAVVRSSVSGNTTIVIAADPMENSKKLTDARRAGIQILSREAVKCI
jgi:NAD-dependent DNA ligase